MVNKINTPKLISNFIDGIKSTFDKNIPLNDSVNKNTINNPINFFTDVEVNLVFILVVLVLYTTNKYNKFYKKTDSGKF